MGTERVVYFNGDFVPESEAKVSIYDSALMFGDMVFEMTRSFNGVQFKLKEHIDRLFIGLSILRIDIGLSKSELEEACLQTIEKNKEKLYLSSINEDLIDQLITIDDEIKKMNLKNIKNKIYN